MIAANLSKVFKLPVSVLIFFLFPATFFGQHDFKRWTKEKAAAWDLKQPWMVGCNYNPYNAINQLEMWQAETFDSAQIDKELGWAESIGMNTLRVFLHDLLWQQDAKGFIVLVLFDSVWDPNPQSGKQREPRPGIHNSGWLQSPGAAALQDKLQYPRLEAYVKGIVKTFANDKRVLAWDVWNEPDNTNDGKYNDPADKVELITKLLPKVFQWCRAVKPVQPLTSGVWILWNGHDWGNKEKWSAIEKIQFDQSDIISFHCYSDSSVFEKQIVNLKKLGRPIMCTEYLARGNKSTIETILPLGKKYKVAMMNWGFVVGKTQTNLPWDSWENPFVNGREPEVWHHEIFYPDGRPYREEEIAIFRKLTRQN
jgi:Cellulase (glycosyl hydrolase family 5)